MKRWTVAAALSAPVLALFAVLTPSCATRVQQRSADQQAEPPNVKPDIIVVAVEDTFRLRYQEKPPALLRDYYGPPEPLAYEVEPADALLGDGRGGFRAAKVGDATITLTKGALALRRHVRVIPADSARKLMVLEVCPNDDEPAIRSSRKKIVSEQVERVHEYHDCQRLIENGKYSAAVGIFAHQVRDAQGNPAPPPQFRDGVTAATILNFRTKGQDIKYVALGIHPGTNCLVLKYGPKDTWSAILVHEAGSVAPCPSYTWAEAIAKPHDVLRVRPDTTGHDLRGNPHVPQVARWDWDPEHLYNYIGIACGPRTWCEIGPDSFVSSPPLTVPAPGNPTERLAIAKGLYDQQFLADASGGSPSTVFGTIRPGPDAESHDQMKHDPNHPPYRVAIMELRDTAAAPSPEYERYYKDYIDPFGAPAVNSASTVLTLQARTHNNSRYIYKGAFNGKPLAEDTGVVARTHAHLKGMTPIVRWRWRKNDESAWSYCAPDGCCENIATLRALLQ